MKLEAPGLFSRFVIPRTFFVLILGFLVLLESSEAKGRSFEELQKAMEAADRSWSGKEMRSSELLQHRVDYLKSWTNEEVVTASETVRFSFNEDWADAVLRRWGMIDPDSALSFFLEYLEKEKAERKRMPWKYGSYDTIDLTMEIIWVCVNSVLIGWAEKEPMEAWKALIDPEGRITRNGLLPFMNVNRSILLAGKVAGKEPDYALGKAKDKHSVLRWILLEGMSRVLPKNYPWVKLFAEVSPSIGKDDVFEIDALRRSLLGRWMEADAEAAEQWFQSPEGKKIVGDLSLSKAAGYWLERDPGPAREWLKGKVDLIAELIEASDPDLMTTSERFDLRETVVLCLRKPQREKLIRSLHAKDQNQNPEWNWRLVRLIGTEGIVSPQSPTRYSFTGMERR